MRENNRKPIEKCRKKLPQFTTMNVIDGQAGLVIYSSLIFYSLTIDNILNIIVLLILVGVTIATLTGENGIITRANEAKSKTEQAQKDEEAKLDDLETFIQEALGNVYNEEKGVNAPKLTTNMKLVTFNSSNNTWIEDTTQNAYSYIDTSIVGNTNKSEWANAEVTVDGITSYFVWIPRYAYKITYYTDENKAIESSTPTAYGTIDVKFIKGTKNIATDGTVCKYANENPDVTKNYVVHPAFTKDASYGGGWDNELPGIWIGKYEASLANKNDGSNIIPNNSNANILLSDNPDKTIVTKPGYSSWRYCTVGNMYTNALSYDSSLKSHMLKNSEWGAVAYLTESQYGKNGTEVEQDKNGQYLTGGGEGNNYISLANVSSTGNVYGIYSLNGGSWEYVASYLKNEDFSSAESTFTDGINTKYSTAYDTDNEEESYKYGDATYETSGWNQDRAGFIKSVGPFFIRGSNSYVDSNESGIFYYADSTGERYSSASFRLALAL